VWGLSAATGIFAGGTLTDKHGARPVIVLGLLFLALAFASSATLLSKAAAVGPALVAIVIWGLSAWAFFPAQQTRLIGIAGIRIAPIVLSLNASFRGCHVAVRRARSVGASRIVRPLRPRCATCPSPRREACGAFGPR